MVIWTVKVWLQVIYYDSWISFCMCLTLCSSGPWWRSVQGFLSWPLDWLREWSTVISWVSWWALVWRWSAVWSAMARMMCTTTWVWALWINPVMFSVVPVVWPGMASVRVMVTFSAVSVIVIWTYYIGACLHDSGVRLTIVVSMLRLWSVVTGRCTLRWYPVQTIHCYVSVFITLETSNTGQWCAMWPDSWHWKQWSSTWDITFTVDIGINVAVSCCATWSFLTSDIASVRVYGPFS